jgi:3-dehydroquinate synthase
VTAPAFTLHGSAIHVAAGLLDGCGPLVRSVLGSRRLVIITDQVVAPYYLERLSAALGGEPPLHFKFPPGERHKTREMWTRLTDAMLASGVGRDAAVLALGGGVVGDLAGFVAATYMRGIPVVQLPTTLLAMIDASVGGKTGVDTSAGKNLVGAFHHPVLVLADPSTLDTLPLAHRRNGLAEAVKHGAIASAPMFAWLEANAATLTADAPLPRDVAEQLVRENIAIKASVVDRDEREGGLRKILNFGHTVGHAIELTSDFALLHGECVAMGMMVEARIAAALGFAEPALAERLGTLISALGLPTDVPSTMNDDIVLEATRADKKARAGAVEYALPHDIGTMAGADRGYGIAVADDVVSAALAASR